MQKRNTQQRRSAIVELVNQHGKVTVDELKSAFSTSQVTIRKDLSFLEDKGLVLRKFGGAVAVHGKNMSANDEKVSNRKKSIAKAALSLIKDHSRIVIDSGSTTAAMLPYLAQKPGLVVMTNALHVAQTLVDDENEPTVLMTGGTWDSQSRSFQGQMAEQILRAYNFDQAFLGAAGLDIQKGTTTFNELTNLSRVMAEVSNQVIVMAESAKLEHKIPNVELPWSKISVLVTDSDISSSARQCIEQQGVKVICAEQE
ncbi:DeoR/GlpR family DNA-binding transcription regulator [Neptunicella sp. SCSIO 80796]|uniref:DeoR/GlpR family DNA-binding transcription regulator n=1 Tax=Neptunicella plasticusilytica TaxID=3117012 RepID=UPI003A4DDD95